MFHELDHSVRELGSTLLKLRGDLIFTPHTSAGQPYYIVEDPLNSRFFRLGHAEYTFVSLLDGHATTRIALRRLSTVMPNHQLSEGDVAELCRWLIEMDVAHTAESSQASRLADNAQIVDRRKAQARWNPLVFRLPLGRPDRLVALLAQTMGWIFSPLVTVGWLLLVVVGTFHLFFEWDRFVASSQGIFAPDNWIWLAGCWVVLKIVHEMSHGIVCKRYGGTVRETGILFILFTPMAFVDVTSSWRFRSRWQRIHVAAAGMYSELLIASVAAIIWSDTDSGWLNNLCFNIILMASITTLLFNANPLMKFDGYYILSDGLAMPNLYVNGQSYLRYWARRTLLGVPATLPDWPRWHGAFIRLYGWTSFFWRIVICVSLTITAATLFHGTGIVLAGIAILLWFGLPTLRFVKYLMYGRLGEQPHRIRFFLTTGLAFAILAIVLGCTPWPGKYEAPAVVEYSPHTVIRAASAGFVKEIHVASSERVETGQLLVVLENRQLALDLSDLELQIRQSEIRDRQHEQKGELAAQQAEAKNREALQTQLSEIRAQVDSLTVRAPTAGKIIRRNLHTLLGTYLKMGDETLSIGHESQKELRLSIAQEDLDIFSERTGKLVCINIPRYALWRSALASVIPRATVSLGQPALSAVNGGPLPVKPIASHTDNSVSDSHELLEPRFTAIIPLSHSDGLKLRAGQRARVSYRPLSESIGEHLLVAASAWIRKRFSP